ncbi:unnamed protein product [Lactuca saligna]|uniref:GDSL esterase/lipase n=1 Tax=Lactuca saligna TaxID=75948 RepID=A0AA36A1V6_LACSI|nr:unnamed protein product [Lactuca saligna]
MQVFLLLHRQLSFLLLLLVLPLLLLLQLQCSGISNDSNQSPCDLGKRCRLKVGTHIVPAVIVFGDSVVDTGNNNNLATVFKVNYPPYGKDFYGGQPTGRFSNGKVPPDLIVEELGIKEVLPPYLGPSLPIEDLRTGVNFASGGGGYDPLTSQLASVISLPGQIELFKEYLEKVKSMAGEEAVNDILSKGLFVVVTGSNDVTNTYFNNPLRRYHFDFESYSRLLVDSASSFLQDLYNLGVRRIGVFSLPPIGCLPSQRTLVGGIQRECVKNYNELAELFNTKLSMEINSLSQRLPFAKMVYVDAYYLPLDMIQNPAKYEERAATSKLQASGPISGIKNLASLNTENELRSLLTAIRNQESSIVKYRERRINNGGLAGDEERLENVLIVNGSVDESWLLRVPVEETECELKLDPPVIRLRQYFFDHRRPTMEMLGCCRLHQSVVEAHQKTMCFTFRLNCTNGRIDGFQGPMMTILAEVQQPSVVGKKQNYWRRREEIDGR